MKIMKKLLLVMAIGSMLLLNANIGIAADSAAIERAADEGVRESVRNSSVLARGVQHCKDRILKDSGKTYYVDNVIMHILESYYFPPLSFEIQHWFRSSGGITGCIGELQLYLGGEGFSNATKYDKLCTETKKILGMEGWWSARPGYGEKAKASEAECDEAKGKLRVFMDEIFSLIFGKHIEEAICGIPGGAEHLEQWKDQHAVSLLSSKGRSALVDKLKQWGLEQVTAASSEAAGK
jgi:hypothetical protein